MCDKVLNAFWIDNKPVNYLSTMHPPECDNDTPENLCVLKKEKKKGQSAVTVSCAPCVQDYNKWIGGVDFCDKIINFYNCRCRSKKNAHLEYFFHLLEVAVLNTSVLESYFVPYRSNGNFVRKHLDF